MIHLDIVNTIQEVYIWMTEEEIMNLWRQGLSKFKLAILYKRRYNQTVKLIRLDIRHRHDNKFITDYEALAYIERVLYKNVINNKTMPIK